MKNKRILLMLIVLVMIVSLVGCGTSSSDQSSGASEGASTGASSMASDSTEASSGPAKTSLTVCKSSDVNIITPFTDKLLPMNQDSAVMFSMYDPLLWRDSTDGSMNPCLAKEWSVSDDGLDYTFKLRDDVTFWDGTSMTAEDVAFTMDLAQTNPSMARIYYVGYESCEIVNDYEVVVHLSEPYAPFLNVFGGFGCLIMSKAYFEEVGWDGYLDKPMGTGPYKFVSKVAGSSITLEANEEYWDGAPPIKDVTWKFIADNNSQMLALEAGEIDLLLDAPVTSLRDIDESKGITWDYCPSYRMTVLSFNGNTGSIGLDENFRKAVACAIDYNSVNLAVLDGKGTRPPINTPVGYTARPLDGTYADPFGYDPVKAKEFLEASSYVPGTEWEVICISGTKEEGAAKVMQGNLQEIGINMQIAATDYASYIQNLMNVQYDGSLYAGMGPMFDADYVFMGFNRTASPFAADLAFDDIEHMNDIGLEALILTDVNKRIEIYTELANLVNEKAYSVLIYNDVTTLAYNKDLKGVVPVPAANYRLSDYSW